MRKREASIAPKEAPYSHGTDANMKTNLLGHEPHSANVPIPEKVKHHPVATAGDTFRVEGNEAPGHERGESKAKEKAENT
ncbi:MAG: hypothetical protein ACREA9_00995, partial [Pyrinomonadaceae bacterium]